MYLGERAMLWLTGWLRTVSLGRVWSVMSVGNVFICSVPKLLADKLIKELLVESKYLILPLDQPHLWIPRGWIHKEDWDKVQSPNCGAETALWQPFWKPCCWAWAERWAPWQCGVTWFTYRTLKGSWALSIPLLFLVLTEALLHSEVLMIFHQPLVGSWGHEFNI